MNFRSLSRVKIHNQQSVRIATPPATTPFATRIPRYGVRGDGIERRVESAVDDPFSTTERLRDRAPDAPAADR
jgi:hypothetical protein